MDINPLEIQVTDEITQGAWGRMLSVSGRVGKTMDKSKIGSCALLSLSADVDYQFTQVTV